MNTLRTLAIAATIVGGFVSQASAQGYPNPVWDVHAPYQAALNANRPANPEAHGPQRRAHAPQVTGSIARHALPPGAVDFREWQLLHSRGR